MDIFWLATLFVLGACVGSFLNVVVYRLPRGQSIVFPGSHCPACGRPIRGYDNIPLLSWLVLRGKCRDCRAPISPRYILVEATTAILLAGLYACYYLLDIRNGVGKFDDTWPMFTAHAALLCGLLVCALVDIELWLIPLEVTWTVAIVALAAAGFRPHAFWPGVGPTLTAMSFAAVIGLGVAVFLVRQGFIRPSFQDVSDAPRPLPNKGQGKNKHKKPASVAITSADGVNPRKEVLREVLFLSPAILLAAATAMVLAYVPSVGKAWRELLDVRVHPLLAPRVLACGSAAFGYLAGGAIVWGMRILGTLGFGKEAMGLGDVHILACVGAATGWIVPLVAFFLAPFLGLLWAGYLWIGRRQRELPYGPWLAAAAVVVMLFYDGFIDLLKPYAEVFDSLAGK